MTNKPTIQFYGKITLLQPGQFKPLTIVPLDETSVVVINVPLFAEYIANIEAVGQNQSGTNHIDPIWTDKGVQYIYNKLNKITTPDEVTPEDFAPEDKPHDEEW